MRKKILIIVMICALLCMTLSVFASCNRTDYMYFGAYPQTLVTDDAIIGALNSAAGALPTAEDSHAWTSYDYYIAEGAETDYMWYIDLVKDGEKYRGVYFTWYRPHRTTFETRLDQGINLNNSYQDENGYLAERVYWFKYEPIKWAVLEEEDGEALLLADMILDSREYCVAPAGWPEREEVYSHNGGTGYANNYALSDIRIWLNDSFYSAAFNDSEKAAILLSTVANGARSTNPTRDAAEWNEGANECACADTEDYVFLISAEEVTNKAYGFSKNPESDGSRCGRVKNGTDYALALGLNRYDLGSNDKNSSWWLRSADFLNMHCARYVTCSGYAEGREVVDASDCGVVPAIRIKKA